MDSFCCAMRGLSTRRINLISLDNDSACGSRVKFVGMIGQFSERTVRKIISTKGWITKYARATRTWSNIVINFNQIRVFPFYIGKYSVLSVLYTARFISNGVYIFLYFLKIKHLPRNSSTSKSFYFHFSWVSNLPWLFA